MSDLAEALLAALDEPALRTLAERLAPFMPERDDAHADDWLDTKGAAEYLGMTVEALHKLTGPRLIPVHQEAPNCKCFFKRSELDDWRERGGSRAWAGG